MVKSLNSCGNSEVGRISDPRHLPKVTKVSDFTYPSMPILIGVVGIGRQDLNPNLHSSMVTHQSKFIV